MSSSEEKTNTFAYTSFCDEIHDSVSCEGPKREGNFKVYRRRWYILFVFSICSALNGMKWNTWGPIQGTSQVVFGWSDTTITLMVAWGPIVYIISFLPISWLMDTKGENILNCSKQGLVDWYFFFVNNEGLRDINNTKTLHIDRPTRIVILNSWHLIRFLGMPPGLDNLKLGLDHWLWSLDRTLAYTRSNYSFLNIWLLILGRNRDHFVFSTQHLCYLSNSKRFPCLHSLI